VATVWKKEGEVTTEQKCKKEPVFVVEKRYTPQRKQGKMEFCQEASSNYPSGGACCSKGEKSSVQRREKGRWEKEPGGVSASKKKAR